MSYPLPFSIAFENDDLLVANKPTNMLVHPTKPGGPKTLIDWLTEAYPDENLAIINRLDRDTSGLVLVSKHREAASRLGKMTMRREFQKKYSALVIGKPPVSGEIDAPLDRIGNHHQSQIYLKQGVFESGASARTLYETRDSRYREDGTPISLLTVQLETGRLHQIRVHLSYIGFPVVGDKIYGPDETCYLEFIENGWTDRMEGVLWLRRHALHADTLAFKWEGTPIEVTIPMAKDLDQFWNSLKPEAFKPSLKP